MKHKTKAIGWLLALALFGGLLPGVTLTARAEEPAPASTGSTYTITIPSTLAVQNVGWNPIGSISITGALADVNGRHDVLTLTASSANDWNLKRDAGGAIAYRLKETAEGEAATSWEFTDLSQSPAVAVGIDVDDYSNLTTAGIYADTITFTAAVETRNTVKFEMNGDGAAIATQYVSDGAKIAAPTEPTASAARKAFGGWYTDAACTNQWNFDSAVTEPVTLYAKWTAKQKITLKIPVSSDIYLDDAPTGDKSTSYYVITYCEGETWSEAIENCKKDRSTCRFRITTDPGEANWPYESWGDGVVLSIDSGRPVNRRTGGQVSQNDKIVGDVDNKGVSTFYYGNDMDMQTWT